MTSLNLANPCSLNFEESGNPVDRKRGLILPVPDLNDGVPNLRRVDVQTNARLCAWLDERISQIKTVWGNPIDSISASFTSDRVEETVAQIIRTLLHRTFNHQSRGSQQPILPEIRRCLGAKVASGRPVVFFLLYNGGYRAAPFPGRHGLIFTPDQTELLLLYQISLLQERISKIYPPGIKFVVVINNGVASWVNDIPIDWTELYATRFREMIGALGASSCIHLLAQSEMPGFQSNMQIPAACAPAGLTPKEHSIVERFLGRPCGDDEARQRFAFYTVAEKQWADHLAPVAASEAALLLRQVSHPAMLSFRPFPGGAIRTQNGSVGFAERDGCLVPKLVTSESFERHEVKLATFATPWQSRRDCFSPASTPNV